MTVPAARIRAFIASPLPAALVGALRALIAGWRGESWAQSVRWVRPESLHLTLRFLGDVSPEQLAAIRAGVADVVLRHAARALTIGAVGPFPSARRARVIALHLADDFGLAALVEDLETVAVDCGLSRERHRFHPHVTIGRVRGRLVGPPPTSTDLEGRSLDVDTIVLFRSELERSGARHTELARFALASSVPRSG